MTDPSGVVEGYLRERGIESRRTGERDWALRLPGRVRHELTLILSLGESSLRAEAFFMRCPLEDHAAVWRLMLRQNLRAPVSFAVDDAGDAYVVARIPLAALDEDALDGLLGAMLTVVEDTFMPAIELGFANYLAHDRAWRARQRETSF